MDSIRFDLEETTLPRLLTYMDQVDQMLLNLPETEMQLMGEVAKEKVDGICKYFEALDARVTQLREMKLAIAATQKALERKYEAFEEFLTQEMIRRGIEKLPGNVFQMAVSKRDKVVCDPVEFTDEFITKYRPYIRSKHEFKKTELKADLTQGHFDLPFARVIKNPSIQFTIKRKEIEK